MNATSIVPIKGAVQHYAWGGKDFIPNLLQETNSEQRPYAELWMGTHDRGPAIVQVDGREMKLEEWIAQQPQTILGQPIIGQFGAALPFLFKVLDVAGMLSIQAHPNKSQAEEGFKKENRLGIPLTARNRNFKDDNHKPELMVAVTEFWLLHGFKSAEAINELLQSHPEFQVLQPVFAENSLYDLYKQVMSMPQAEVDTILEPFMNRISAQSTSYTKDQPEYWALRAIEEHQPKEGKMDRGIFSIFFFNLLKLAPGQGIFQDAGIPHAYLEGVNMELMANSDNVFRGGLTVKHIDVDELMEHLVFESVDPKIIGGTKVSDFETVYKTPAPDFELSRMDFSEGETYEIAASEVASIAIVLEGDIAIKDFFPRTKGEIFFIPAHSPYTVHCHTTTTLFRASVPA